MSERRTAEAREAMKELRRQGEAYRRTLIRLKGSDFITIADKFMEWLAGVDKLDDALATANARIGQLEAHPAAQPERFAERHARRK